MSSAYLGISSSLRWPGAAIEVIGFDAAVRRRRGSCRRRLVDAATLHADETVLDQSRRPMPFSCRLVSPRQQVAGDMATPSMATASPFSKSTVM